MVTLSLTKVARIYNGEKTIFLTSGAMKTGQLLGSSPGGSREFEAGMESARRDLFIRDIKRD